MCVSVVISRTHEPATVQVLELLMGGDSEEEGSPLDGGIGDPSALGEMFDDSDEDDSDDEVTDIIASSMGLASITRQPHS